MIGFINAHISDIRVLDLDRDVRCLSALVIMV